MKNKITMKSIAEELGISVVTVSKALANQGGCSENLRESILQKAAELGYQYDKKTNKYKTKDNGIGYDIGVLVADRFFAKNAFYSELYRFIMKEASENQCTVIMELVQKEMEEKCVTPLMIEAQKISGLIILGEFKKEYLKFILSYNIPYVVVDSYCNEFNVDAVIGDNLTGTYRLTDFLIKRGHKTFQFVGSISATASIVDRYIGCLKAILLNGLSLDCICQSDDRDESGKMIQVPLPKVLPDAFICNCDQTAYYLLEHLKQEGYSVPADVSVVGFDDFMYPKLYNPQLTTYSVNMAGMAKTAITMLVKKMNQEPITNCHVVMEGRMVERKSTK